jgi:hypothetical protein
MLRVTFWDQYLLHVSVYRQFFGIVSKSPEPSALLQQLNLQDLHFQQWFSMDSTTRYTFDSCCFISIVALIALKTF